MRPFAGVRPLLWFLLAFSIAFALGMSTARAEAVCVGNGCRYQAVQAVELPLEHALRVLAAVGGYDLLAVGVDADTAVRLPHRVTDWRRMLHVLVESHDLAICGDMDDGLVVVVGGARADRCRRGVDVESVSDLPSPDADSDRADVFATGDGEVVVEAQAEVFRLRLRVLELNETRGAQLGINWEGRTFETASALVQGARYMLAGFFPSPLLDDTIRFLEREGVARRLDDLALTTVSRQMVTFQSGGSINVQLVGSGAQNIQRSFNYGLRLGITPERLDGDVIQLAYTFSDTDPGNTTDPSLITLASRDVSSVVHVRCGYSTVLASLGSIRHSGEGSGLPVASRITGAGYLAGAGSDSEHVSTLVLTLDVECPGVSYAAR
jgi:hypothetical protein